MSRHRAICGDHVVTKHELPPHPPDRKGLQGGDGGNKTALPSSPPPQAWWMKTSSPLLSSSEDDELLPTPLIANQPSPSRCCLRALMSSVTAIIMMQNRGHKIDNICPMDQMLRLLGRL
ncbi:hypothetical protein VPH35_132783 [Triticum aestivum]|uniref:uncharacterized protein isoform X3 n=1 Tax=Triticum aestivum TaxID=4565 RepID=UPI001D016857|nr:uncharacterized protein LOC123161632 isoform X3 [Triticum aestivum]